MAFDTSGYKTVQETAEAWGVTKRWVTMCIADGRIYGAVKVGNMWLLPKGAEKPTKGKHTAQPRKESLLSELIALLAVTYRPIPLGSPEERLGATKDKRLRAVFEVGIAFWRGDYEQALCRFRETEGNDAAKLCACPSAISAAICAGDYPRFTEIETFLKELRDANPNDGVAAFAELALATAYTGAMAPGMIAGWLKTGDFSAVPTDAKMDALYTRAKYCQGLKQYDAMLAVAQTALVFAGSPQMFFHSDINLKMACAIALCELNRKAEAEHHLLAVMRVCLPLGFYTPLSLNIPLAGGLIETLLERDYPAYAGAVMAQAKRMIPNWIIFHNRFTKENITHLLSQRDYQMARLVAQGMPYGEIAERFSMSPGTLTNRMQIIYEMLFITGKDRRKALAQFIL